ncbi:MAG: DUF3307 domain-containing protein [Pyrinomonadaceae bacterium]|nr:DUF3307 domain-containing protein [Pyrinomonadaceae bacterium]
MNVLSVLILAHLVGDFLLQPASWVEAKEIKKLQAWQLYAHSLIHGVLSIPAAAMSGKPLIVPTVIVTHFLIDALKLYRQTEDTRRRWFFIDQFAHFVVIFFLFLYAVPFQTRIFLNELSSNISLIAGIVLLTKPASIAIKIFISRWTPQIGEMKDPAISDTEDLESLESAGKYIGILERLFVFTFVVSGQWQAIGFLIAAKSIFRFGYLKESRNRKLTEYIIIGTLTSFGAAIATALLYLRFRNY